MTEKRKKRVDIIEIIAYNTFGRKVPQMEKIRREYGDCKRLLFKSIDFTAKQWADQNSHRIAKMREVLFVGIHKDTKVKMIKIE